ncbi:MAG: valine--tRNA ligase [Candidatus Caenarcaniphilales bacterium]|nr:valine--tRNA ligase [Candidatus Caenarcaniphilales bacterium]
MTAKNYDPALVEAKPLPFIPVEDALSADFIICLPPPNVTGELHMGHALNSTLQDVMIRFNRLKGKKAHWQIGCDHAGIGTQIVVEKQLSSEGLSKYDLGREDFEKRSWEWTRQYLGRIEGQLKRLGCSPDWSRSAFTLNPEYSLSVREAFFELYREGLIYRGKRLINWCPKCCTSLSDLEVIHEEQNAKLFEIRYLPIDPSDPELIVSTSRPETIFADTALAINPKDDRYKDLLVKVKAGKEITYKIPLSGKCIPLILSDKVLLDFGTGVLKITPAHDFNDAYIAKEWNQAQPDRMIGAVNILDEKAYLVSIDEVPEYLWGLERYLARSLVLQKLTESEQLVSEKSYRQPTSLHDRCGTAIEPYPSEQTFVRMSSLAKLALDALKRGEIQFYPARYAQTYEAWLEKIEDWCISRQLWWGHQIPVWRKSLPSEGDPEEVNKLIRDQFRQITGECGYPRPLTGDIHHPTHLQGKKAGNEYIWQYGAQSVEVCLKAPDQAFEEKLTQAGYIRDADVLDTWFSSALWPLAAQGWSSQKTPRPYWSDTMCTAREIINLWVSRMIFMSRKLTGKLPFRDILIHPVVQTPDGKRMSKSKGNAIEPIALVERYGADACRLWYCSVGIFGNQDIRFPGKKEKDGSWSSPELEQKRRFLNKLWNALNFMRMQFQQENFREMPTMEQLTQTRDTSSLWILCLARKTFLECEEAILRYDFSAYINGLERFFWTNFCDWYLEIAKFNLSTAQSKTDLKWTMQTVIALFLNYLEPVAPFITRALRDDFGAPVDFTELKFPSEDDIEINESLSDLMLLVSTIRSIRQRVLGIAPNQSLKVSYKEEPNLPKDLHWTKLALVERADQKTERSFQKVLSLRGGSFVFRVQVPKEIDLKSRQTQIEKDLSKKTIELDQLKQKLSDPGFSNNASDELKIKMQSSLDHTQGEVQELTEALKLIEQAFDGNE